jgi:hypothetical protein
VSVPAAATSSSAALDARVDGTDARMDGNDARVDGNDARVDGNDARVKDLRAAGFVAEWLIAAPRFCASCSSLRPTC